MEVAPAAPRDFSYPSLMGRFEPRVVAAAGDQQFRELFAEFESRFAVIDAARTTF
jgi:hypothetical protein